MRTGTHDNQQGWLRSIALALLLCAGLLATPGSAAAQAEPDPRPETIPNYYDPTNVFSEEQRATLVSDAGWLQSTNIPTLVYVRTATPEEATLEQSQIFANSVRMDWQIATEPGADDGMVILLSSVPERPDQTSIVVAWGEHTFDESGLSPGYVTNVLETTIRPLLQDGRPFEAMYIGMREIRYGGIYLPPPVAPLTGVPAMVHDVVNVAGPLAVILVLVAFIYLSLRRGFGSWASRKSINSVTAAVFTIVVVLCMMSVYGRSEVGIASAAFILVGLAIQVWLWTHPSGRSDEGYERAVPPASRRARRRRQARHMGLEDVDEVMP